MSFSWEKVTGFFKRWEYLMGIIGVVLTVLIVLAVLFFWEEIRALEQYGYLGAFIISIFGGATIIAPIPMTPVIFALGTVMKPAFAPYMGPVFVGIAAGLGETIGGLAIYMTGYGGGTALHDMKEGKVKSGYQRMMGWVQRRGTLTIFVLSAAPLFFDLAGIAAGALRFPVWKFFLACWLGRTLLYLVIAWVGAMGWEAVLGWLG